MQKRLDKLTKQLKIAPLEISRLSEFDIDWLDIELLIANGYPINIIQDKICLKTATTKIYEQTFCLVDIETTHANINKGQIIEIGAIKIKNNHIIETFHSFAYIKKIPTLIQEITHISPKLLLNAPKIEELLWEFKKFLEDDVFVAHNVDFDYNFISNSLEKYSLGVLYNRKICSIELAKKTIESEKYGLKTLKELLNIENELHRAFDDTISLSEVFKVALSKIDTNQTTEDLIDCIKDTDCVL